MRSICIFTFAFLLIGLISCEKEKSTENLILSFSFNNFTPTATGTINNELNAIDIWVPEWADLTLLAPSIETSAKAKISPLPEVPNDFTGLALYTVTAENGEQRIYTVKVNKIFNNIISFKFKEFSSVNPTIKNDTIKIHLPASANLKALTPQIQIPAAATIAPAADIAYDFTLPKQFNITSETGVSRVYTVIVTKDAGSAANYLTSIEFPELFLKGTILNQNITVKIPYGLNITSVLTKFNTSAFSTTNLSNQIRLDYTTNKTLIVTAQNGDIREYTISFIVGQQETAIRGIWLTNVASLVLNSKENIVKAVENIEKANINTIFVVTYNKNQTPYPSQVLKNAVNDPNVQTEMFPGRDPLQELITEAHAKNIKVFGWFEYGFASQYGPGSDGGKGPVLRAHPTWESRDKLGNLAERHGFYWMNGFHPEVQQFMIDMAVELVTNYDIDGIQGDDRLPAMPVNAGYDDYTVNLYKSQNGGAAPPDNESLTNWKQWRANLLTDFAGRLYDAVKAAKPGAIVAHAPHPYSYSLDEYLQDWPKWLANGKMDVVMPQLYRKENLDSYLSILNSNSQEAINLNKLNRFVPGLILLVDGTLSSEQYIVDMVRANRNKGVTGECYFFYEGLTARQNIWNILYPAKAIFPSFNK